MTIAKDVTIREAIDQDFPIWISMRKKLWPHASCDELKDVGHLLKSEKFSCFFAETKSEVVGFIEVALRPYVNGCDFSPVAFIEGIWVDDRLQKQGIGRLLISQAESWALLLGVKELASDTRIESTHSIHAHKAWGFEETERVVYFRKKVTAPFHEKP